MKRRATFRCDASPHIGSGHVYRCLTLADALMERGWAVSFMSAPGTEEIVPQISGACYGLMRNVVSDLSCDLLVVDHYDMDADFEGACRPWARRIAVIDDLANRPHDCDFLIDQAYGRQPASYQALVPRACRILTGTDYALLRPQFAAARKTSLERRRTSRNERPRIFVSLGSTNVGGITQTVLRLLENYKKSALEIDVVAGADTPGEDEIVKIINTINQNAFHVCKFHQNIPDMAILMTNADLAIGAGGTTSWERCCVGLPAIVITLADNQYEIVQALAEAGAALDAGPLKNLREEDFLAQFKSLLTDPRKLINMSLNAAALCDGRGAGRVADILS